MKSHEIVSAVRLMAPEDVHALAGIVGSAPHRMELIYVCLKSQRARRELRKFLYSSCTTPEPKSMLDSSPPPAPAPPAPRLAPKPPCARRLDF
jgi:hypothetical protein